MFQPTATSSLTPANVWDTDSETDIYKILIILPISTFKAICTLKYFLYSLLWYASELLDTLEVIYLNYCFFILIGFTSLILPIILPIYSILKEYVAWNTPFIHYYVMWIVVYEIIYLIDCLISLQFFNFTHDLTHLLISKALCTI